MLRLLPLLLLLQGDEKHHLKWILERGQKIQFEWTLVFKSESKTSKETSSPAELTTKILAAGEVVEINLRSEARVRLAIVSYSTKGQSMGKPIAMEFADGKVTGDGPAESILKQMQAPVEMTLSRAGVSNVRWGDQARPEAMGFVGGRMPESAVTEGESWEDSVPVPTATGGERILAIKPKLVKWDKESAQIEAQLDDPIEFATGKGRVRIRRSTQVDVAKHWVRHASSELMLEITGPGKNPVVESSLWSLTVDVTPQK